MQSTNVEYLLENYTIVEIEDIQRKLKNDIERKKEELKHLVGERYRDLIEAADTIHEMNHSVVNVLASIELLQKKSKHIFSKVNDYQNKEIKSHINYQNYEIGTLMKMIINAPLEIWSSLEDECLLDASLIYLNAKYVCKILNESNRTSPLLIQNERAIERFNRIINELCWDFLAKNSYTDTIDETANIDSFCCLLMLNHMTQSKLFPKFIDRRKSDVMNCFLVENDFHKSTCQFINIMFNTIKVIYVIFFDSDSTDGRTSLLQRLEEIANLGMSVINDSKFFSLNKKQILNDSSFKKYASVLKFKPMINAELIDKEIIRNETLDFLNYVKDSSQPHICRLLQNVNSIEYICNVLHDVKNALQMNQRNLEWNEYCEEILNIYWPIWNEFLMDSVIQRMYSIINDKLFNVAFESFKTSIRTFIEKDNDMKDLEVSHFLWSESQTDVWNLSKKANGRLPIVEQLCSNFGEHLRQLLDDMTMLLNDNIKSLLNDQNTEVMLSDHLMNECDKLIKHLIEYLNNLIEKSENNHFTILFSANLLRYLTYSCTPLEDCFGFSKNGNISHKWDNVKENMISFTTMTFKLWFDYFINNMIEKSIPELENPCHFLNSSFIREEITITEQSEDGKTLTSVIEVPLQISLTMHSWFSQICAQINRIAGHTLSKTLVINILITFAKDVNKFYILCGEKLSNAEIPANVKQTYALQWYFDLLYLKQFLSSAKDESLKSEVIPLIHRCAGIFESLIDPFDLHVFFPPMQTNLAKIGKMLSVIFGLMLPESTFATLDSKSKLTQTELTKNDPHNIMVSNNCRDALPLLNLGVSFKKFEIKK